MGCDGCSHQFRVNEQTISLEGGLPMLLEDDFALGTSSQWQPFWRTCSIWHYLAGAMLQDLAADQEDLYVRATFASWLVVLNNEYIYCSYICYIYVIYIIICVTYMLYIYVTHIKISIYLSICLSIYLSVYLSIYMYIYIFMLSVFTNI